MTGFPEVIIVGAGPYGLSVAAHLREIGVDARVFGRCMAFWQNQMPKGMTLKSDGYASNISDPEMRFTLENFCAEKRLPYADEGVPISLENFIDYGHAFQRRRVPQLDERLVVSIDRTSAGFLVRLEDGELISAPKVVVAVGVGYFSYIPPVLAGLPNEMLTHSSEHRDFSPFVGRQVCVIGGGASAVDTAALLHEAGASVHLVARQVCFHDRTPLNGRSLWQRMVRPHSGVGAGWRPAFFATAPLIFSALPQQQRIRIVKNSNGPAGGWAMKERVLGKFPILEGYQPQRAEVDRCQVRLALTRRNGEARNLVVDHVISATGYQNDLRRLGFLSRELSAKVRTADHAPILSTSFESSVPGLYFVGPIAKSTFGPLLRFVYGARFASRQTVRHIAGSASRSLAGGGAAVRAR